MTNTPESQKSRPPTPPPRLVAALAAAMLAIGVVVGAAIGPSPSSSFGAVNVAGLLPALLAHAGTSTPTTPAAAPPPASATPTPASAAATKTPAAATPASTSPETAAPAPTTHKSATTPKAATLAPVTNVWVIQLSGSSFSEVLAQPTAAPYINGQAIHAGTLLSGWSGLEANAFASDTALVSGKPPQLLQTIVQPACPEGAAGAACAAGTPGSVTAADEFLKQTLPTITSSAVYRSSGLIVVTFASIVPATEKELPAGASVATLTSEPPAGALLISPFASAGTRSSVTFDPASATKTIEKLLKP